MFSLLVLIGTFNWQSILIKETANKVEENLRLPEVEEKRLFRRDSLF
jgi:hypothetical protein